MARIKDIEGSKSANKFGVLESVALDSTDTAGFTTMKTFHGLAIVMNDKIVGRLISWQPNMFSRQGDHIYELNSYTFGRPVDYVPGINDSYTISFSRAEMWGEELEKALGYAKEWSDLIEQDKPFTVKEVLSQGIDLYSTWTYKGCWFTKKNVSAFNAKENPSIKINGEISFVSRTLTFSR
jgi:hypothetical protein